MWFLWKWLQHATCAAATATESLYRISYPFLFLHHLFSFLSLQDCHIKTHSSSGEPVPDASQDYVLLSSSENATHTNLRFRRKLNTCDEKFDVPITVSLSLLRYIEHQTRCVLRWLTIFRSLVVTTLNYLKIHLSPGCVKFPEKFQRRHQRLRNGESWRRRQQVLEKKNNRADDRK